MKPWRWSYCRDSNILEISRIWNICQGKPQAMSEVGLKERPHKLTMRRPEGYHYWTQPECTSYHQASWMTHTKDLVILLGFSLSFPQTFFAIFLFFSFGGLESLDFFYIRSQTECLVLRLKGDFEPWILTMLGCWELETLIRNKQMLTWEVHDPLGTRESMLWLDYERLLTRIQLVVLCWQVLKLEEAMGS